MAIKPLIFNLNQKNEKYFPGRYGARKQIDINLKKFIPLKRFFLKRKSEINQNKQNKQKKNIKI